jgi:SpoVK/Ycf46/Vps4 family AAA+-type ATPase
MENSISSSQEIEDLIRAQYVLLYVVSPEEERVAQAIGAIGDRRNRKVIAWSCTEGLKALDDSESHQDIKDPLKALDFISKYENDAIFLLKDFHPYIEGRATVAIRRRLRDLNHELKNNPKYRRAIVLLSAVLNIPAELEKEFAVVDYVLPGRKDIEKIVDEMLHSHPDLTIEARTDPAIKLHVVESALGLTEVEVKNVLSKSLVRTKEFDLETIVGEKKSIIRKSGILDFYETHQPMDGVGGMDLLKNWLNKRSKAFKPEARAFGLPTPKGILLLGVPGCGKSLTAKAVGYQWKMPLLRLDVGKVMGSLVGSSEENMRNAIKTAEAVAPCILWLDELEKGFSGAGGGGQNDSGTTQRVFGTFITWMQEKTSSVFVIATANNVKHLPPELLRKGRFDEIFFIDLPTADERATIVDIHLAKKNRDPTAFDTEKVVAATQGFSGSEIEQAVISALYDAFDERSINNDNTDIDTDRVVASCLEIIPLSKTMREAIEGMREWSRHRARPASHGSAENEETPKTGRPVEL